MAVEGLRRHQRGSLLPSSPSWEDLLTGSDTFFKGLYVDQRGDVHLFCLIAYADDTSNYRCQPDLLSPDFTCLDTQKLFLRVFVHISTKQLILCRVFPDISDSVFLNATIRNCLICSFCSLPLVLFVITRRSPPLPPAPFPTSCCSSARHPLTDCWSAVIQEI